MAPQPRHSVVVISAPVGDVVVSADTVSGDHC